MSEQIFQVISPVTVLDIDGAQRFQEAIERARGHAILDGNKHWAALWCPSTEFAAMAVVSVEGTERMCLMGPMAREEAQEWFRQTCDQSPGEFHFH